MPLPPSAVTASADAPAPAGTFSAADAGLAVPAGQAVTVVDAVAQLAEMFRATAPMPLAGTRPTPGTRRLSRCPGPTGRCPSVRVS